MGPYNLQYLLFSGIEALLSHYPHCFLSESQILFGIGAGPPLIREGPLTDCGEQGRIQDFLRKGCTRLLLYFNTNKPHFFFFAEYQLY